MTPDIVSKIKNDFENPKEILNILESMQTEETGSISDRTYRSILYLAHGSTDKLAQAIELALLDCRDLYWQAEYGDTEVRRYDFNKTFGEQGL